MIECNVLYQSLLVAMLTRAIDARTMQYGMEDRALPQRRGERDSRSKYRFADWSRDVRNIKA